GHDLVLATSGNAVRFLPRDGGRGRAAVAVGAATARALRERGFRVEGEGEEGAESLARALAASGPRRRGLWLRGERAREEGIAVLRAAGWSVDEVVTYRVETDREFAAVLRVVGGVGVCVCGSPAAVEALGTAADVGPAVSFVAVGET